MNAIRKFNLIPILLLILGLGLACNFPGAVATPVIEDQPSQEPIATSEILAAELPTVPGPLEPTLEDQSEATSSPEVVPLSLSGLKVVYIKDGDLWLWNSGTSVQLTATGNNYNPRISADGQVIAFLRPVDDFHLELWAINADGSNERRLVSVSDLDTIGAGVRDPNSVAINPYHYQWIPGSHKLAFNTHQVFEGPGLVLLEDLNVVDSDTLDLTHLLLHGWGGEFIYSPDGSKIAISTPTEIKLLDANGNNYRQVLAYDPVITYSEYRFYAQPIWSEDGTYLRVAIPPADPLALPQRSTRLWTIKVNETQATQDGEVYAVPFFEQAATYSPDLARLIYLRETGQPSENLRELVIATFDGKGEWVYQKTALLRFESWSLDSNHFSFTIGEDQQGWLGGLETPATMLNDDPYGIQDIRWINSDLFLFLRQGSGYFDLLVSAPDSKPELLDSVIGGRPVYDFIYQGIAEQ